MKDFNLDKVACPGCGTSGTGNLHASSQIEFSGHADGEEWISCPDCGNHVDFTEDGTVTDFGWQKTGWLVNILSAMGEGEAA